MRHLLLSGFMGLSLGAFGTQVLHAEDPVTPASLSVTATKTKVTSRAPYSSQKVDSQGQSAPSGGLSSSPSAAPITSSSPIISESHPEGHGGFISGSCCDWNWEIPAFRWMVGEDHRIPSDVDDPFWCRLEFFTGWFKGANTPPLVTTGPQESLGIIGEDGVRVLFGGKTVDLPQHYGSRITLGYWFSPSQCFGVEGSYTFLMNKAARFEEASEGDPLLARPFFNVLNNQWDSAQVANLSIDAFPDILPLFGRVWVDLESRYQAVDFIGTGVIARGHRGRIDWTAGFRYLRLDEGLSVGESLLTPPDVNGVIANRFFIFDDFSTENTFWGASFGLRSQFYWNCWTFGFSSSMALGMTRQTVQVRGGTVQITPPPNGTLSSDVGGVLALSSNIGTQTEVKFTVAPRLEAKVAYQLYDHVQIYAGYQLQIMSSVVRPWDQVDIRVNPNLFPPIEDGGDRLPGKMFNRSTFYINSIFMGLDVSF